MKIQQIYISGKITGNKHYEKDFNDAEEYLRTKYKTVVNPVTLSKQLEKMYKSSLSYSDYLSFDIEALLKCDAIYMLKGWWRSKGARLERHIAKVLRLKIIYQFSYYLQKKEKGNEKR